MYAKQTALSGAGRYDSRLQPQNLNSNCCNRVSQSSPNRVGNPHRDKRMTCQAWSPVSPVGTSGLQSEQAALQLIKQALAGQVSPEQAAKQVAAYASGMQQVGDFATLDTFRADRTGLPDTVWGAGKTPEQIASMLQGLVSHQRTALATRIDPAVADAVKKLIPEVEYNPRASILTLKSPLWDQLPKPSKIAGTIAVVSAGIADQAVAEEARMIAEHMGAYVFRLSDMGTEAIHRVLAQIDALRAADVVIVVAGMDGALPAIIAGLVDAPIVACPTSVGYGAALHGIAPMLACLNAGSPGVSVVNIDNGFGAAMVAVRQLRMANKLSERRAQAAAAMSGNGNGHAYAHSTNGTSASH